MIDRRLVHAIDNEFGQWANCCSTKFKMQITPVAHWFVNQMDGIIKSNTHALCANATRTNNNCLERETLAHGIWNISCSLEEMLCILIKWKQVSFVSRLLRPIHSCIACTTSCIFSPSQNSIHAESECVCEGELYVFAVRCALPPYRHETVPLA